VNTPRSSTPFAQMSAWISSATARHFSWSASSPRPPARRAPRSSATQQNIFEEVKCLGSPRTSQMPRSGSCQCSIAFSICATTIGQTRSDRRSRDFAFR
jgi:hypothetical protein